MRQIRTPLDIEYLTLRELKEIAFEAIRYVRLLGEEDTTPQTVEHSRIVLIEIVNESLDEANNRHQS